MERVISVSCLWRVGDHAPVFTICLDCSQKATASLYRKPLATERCGNLNLARWESETFPAALFDKASRILRRRTYYGIFIFGQGPIF